MTMAHFDESRTDKIAAGAPAFQSLTEAIDTTSPAGRVLMQGLEVARFDLGAKRLTYAESCMGPVVLFLGGLRHFLALEARIEDRSPPRTCASCLRRVPPLGGPRSTRAVIILKKPLDAG